MTAAGNTSADLIGQLAETWGSIEALGAGLSPEDWAIPTACPGWTVADQVAHVFGTESLLAGRTAPVAAGDEAPYVRNDIGRINEQWVAAGRAMGPERLLAGFREVTAERLAALRALPEEAWEVPSLTPVGQAPYRRFMQIRVFDSWVHEQDMRAALDRPGHLEGPAAEQSVDEVERALGYLVGKQAAAPEGSRVTIELTGPVIRHLHVVVEGRARVVEALSEADVTVALTSPTFLALACGRMAPEDAVCTIEGNGELGRRVVEHLAFTI